MVWYVCVCSHIDTYDTCDDTHTFREGGREGGRKGGLSGWGVGRGGGGLKRETGVVSIVNGLEKKVFFNN